MTFSWKAPFRLSRALFRAFLWFCHGRPVIAPKWAVNARKATCRPCRYNDHGPDSYEGLGDCRKCSCVISMKILLSSEECPDGRWKSLTLKAKHSPIDNPPSESPSQ